MTLQTRPDFVILGVLPEMAASVCTGAKHPACPSVWGIGLCIFSNMQPSPRGDGWEQGLSPDMGMVSHGATPDHRLFYLVKL